MGYKPMHQVGNAGGEFEKRREELAGHAKAGAALGESTFPLSREHKRCPLPQVREKRSRMDLQETNTVAD